MPEVEAFGPPKKLPKVRYTDFYEGVDRTPCTITLPQELLEAFFEYGMQVGITHNALIALALDQYLRRHAVDIEREEKRR